MFGCGEELLDAEGQPKTSHTLNRVPLVIYDNTVNRSRYQLAKVANPGLANLAATVAVLLGLNDYPKSWSQALITADDVISVEPTLDRAAV